MFVEKELCLKNVINRKQCELLLVFFLHTEWQMITKIRQKYDLFNLLFSHIRIAHFLFELYRILMCVCAWFCAYSISSLCEYSILSFCSVFIWQFMSCISLNTYENCIDAINLRINDVEVECSTIQSNWMSEQNEIKKHKCSW